jgi:hypothetical protein
MLSCSTLQAFAGHPGTNPRPARAIGLKLASEFTQKRAVSFRNADAAAIEPGKRTVGKRVQDVA